MAARDPDRGTAASRAPDEVARPASPGTDYDRSASPDVHHEYDGPPDAPLTVEVLGPDPLAAYRRWLAEAQAADLHEPAAATLATVDADGRPDARMVLLREIGDTGVVFYTNRRSTKGGQLAATPEAALVSYWGPWHRQVRLRGAVTELSDAASDAYFATRPRGSRIAAWASAQSEELTDRRELEERVRELEERYRGVEVPRPPHWGGYLVTAAEVEFWQGRPARLHERLRYRATGDGTWHTTLLQP